MAISRKHSRPIVVDGVAYRWRVPRRATYDQFIFHDPLTAVVWREDRPGAVLRLTGRGPRPNPLMGRRGVLLLPAEVAAAIRAALAAGWTPGADGDFPLTLPKGEPPG